MPAFLLSPVPGDIALAIGGAMVVSHGAMAAAITALWRQVSTLVNQNYREVALKLENAELHRELADVTEKLNAQRDAYVEAARERDIYRGLLGADRALGG